MMPYALLGIGKKNSEGFPKRSDFYPQALLFLSLVFLKLFLFFFELNQEIIVLISSKPNPTIYERIDFIRTRERLSIEAFERQIGIGRNSLSTSLRKKSAISHEVVI